MKWYFASLVILCSLLISCTATSDEWRIQSPNDEISLVVTADNGKVHYAAEINGKVALAKSKLGLVREDQNFSENLTFKSATNRTIKEKYSTITGKRIHDINHCNEMTLSFENENKQPVEMIFRAYDDAVAFRYNFPQKDENIHRVIDELSSFNLNTTGGKAWMQTYDTLLHWSLGYEIPYDTEIPIGTPADVSYGWALPLLFQKENGVWMLISEADLDKHYCGMHVKKDAPGGNYRLEFPEAYECYGKFSRYPESSLPWQTPWRFVIIGDDLGDLVESNIVNHLSRPTKYENTDWIEPGRASWSWWSDPASSSDYIPLKNHVDLATEMDWKYSLVDADWDIMVNGNIDQLADYAKVQDVELFVWYNSGGPNNKVAYRFVIYPDTVDALRDRGVPEEVLAKVSPIIGREFFPEAEYFGKIKDLLGDDYKEYVEAIIAASTFRNARPRDRFYETDKRVREFKEIADRGIKGLKLDFFASDKQEIIKLYLNIFKEAAKNKILINTHGSTIPRGWSKTYPNLLTMEAVMGAEMYGGNHWPELAPTQNTIYPFLRNIVGPMDYTPGTFSTRKGGHPHITTNTHELALTVLFETGLLHISDHADLLRQMPKPVINFLKAVPVVWNDIHFIDGYPGDFAVLARETNDKVYIAGINGKKQDKSVSFVPSFLEEGNHTGTFFLEGANKEEFKIETRKVTKTDEISLAIKPLGGFVIVVEKDKRNGKKESASADF
ncbi:MAG: glycoside hydrolase family 97 N-terminal domain-containing protein [Fidelibacterota bacterium]